MASVGDGVLTITAHRQDGGANGYTSARLVSKGKGDFLYGRIEARAKLPSGRGTWPAIWMLPTGQAHGGWPASREIDLMAHVGYAPGRVHVRVHATHSTTVTGPQKRPDESRERHKEDKTC